MVGNERRRPGVVAEAQQQTRLADACGPSHEHGQRWLLDSQGGDAPESPMSSNCAGVSSGPV